LEKAQNYLNTAMSIKKYKTDIVVIQAQFLTNWVAFDGMKYAAKNAELYNKAYAIVPKNTMVVLNKADWNMGSARYFGQDTKPFCKDVEKAKELFANFKPEKTFYPNWGRERAESILKSCN
jgi:hypothetical protein